MCLRRKAGTDERRQEAFSRIETDARRFDLVARRDQVCAFCRGFERFRDHHRDRLTGIADPVALQKVEPKRQGIWFLVGILRQRRAVGWRDDFDHTRMGLCRSNIQKCDAAARDARHREHRIEHAGRMMIGGISGGARHFEHAVAAGERLTDIRAVADMSKRLCGRDLRHERELRERGQRASRVARASARRFRRQRARAPSPRRAARARS
jgi:ribosomal protein S13